MAAYLRSYVESVAELPSELARKLKLMRELDEKAHALQAEAEAASRRRLEGTAQQAEASAALPLPAKRLRTAYAAAQSNAAAAAAADERIEADMAQALAYTDEKIGLAQQIYDYVDQRIRRLDKDLAAFEGDIARERARLGIPEGETAAAQQLADDGGGGAKPKKGRGGGRGSRGGRGGAGGRGALAKGPGLLPLAAAEAGAVLDPTEPVYCYCRRVSFGEMVACDNPDCAIEWFHFECAGVAEQPKGRWFCRDCEALRAAGELAEGP